MTRRLTARRRRQKRNLLAYLSSVPWPVYGEWLHRQVSWQRPKMRSATLFSLLSELESEGTIVSRWETLLERHDKRRHTYQLIATNSQQRSAD